MQGSFKVISTPEQDGQTLQGSFRVISEGEPTKEQQKSIDAWKSRLRADHQFSDVGLTFTPDYDRLAKEKARESGYSIPENPVNRAGAYGINHAQGALLQWGDEISGLMGAAGETLQNVPKLAYNAPGALAGNAKSKESIGEVFDSAGAEYRKNTDEFRLLEDMADAYRPGTNIAGEVAGGLTIPLLGPLKAAATGTYAAGKPLLNFATTTLGGGALSGFLGGAYGAGQADEGDRAQLAKDYGTFGAAAGAVMSPGVRYVVAPFLGAVGRKLFSSSEDKAVDIILKRAERAGVSLDDVRAQFEAWNKTGDVPETLAELMGPQEKQLLSALITVNRETRETAADVFTKRNRGEAQRLKDGLEGSTGVRGDQFHDEAVRLRQERATAAKPLYDAAHYANDGSLRTLGDDSVTSLYALFRNSETAQRTLERAASEADLLGMPHIRDEIRRFATGLGQGQRPQAMTVQAADYIERNLNDLVRAASKGDSTATNLGTVGALRGFRDQVRSIIDDTGLGAARQRSADAIRAEELLEEGRKALRPGTDIEDVRANLGGDPTRDIPAATDAGRRAYMMGAVRGVSDDLDNQADMGGFANQARALARTPAVRAKIDEIKPKRLTKSGAEDKRFAQTRANAAFDETIDRVADRSQTSVDMIGNSATAFRQGAVDDVMLDFGAGQAAGDVVKDAMTNGPWQALTNRASRAVGAGVDRVFRPGIYNDRINRAAADILLSSGEQIPKQINALAQRAQKRGFNVGGPPPNAPLIATARNAMAKETPKQAGFAPELVGTTAGGTIGIDLDGDGNISYQERLAGAGAGFTGARVARGVSNRAEELAYGQKLTPARAQQLAEEGFDTSKTYYHGSPNRTISGEFSTSAEGSAYGPGIYLSDSKDYARKFKFPNRQKRMSTTIGPQNADHIEVPFPIDPKMLTKGVSGKVYESSIRGKGIDQAEVAKLREDAWNSGLRTGKIRTEAQIQADVTKQLQAQGYTHEIIRMPNGTTTVRVFDPKDVAGHNTLAKPDVKQFGGDAPPRNPPSRKQRVGGAAGDVLALGSLAALGAPPAEGETTDFSADIAATSDRITQLESQIIPSIEADLTILMEGDGSPESIKKIQQLMNMRLGSNLKVDGALGTETSKAIQAYRADVQAQLQTAQSELDQARQRRNQLEFRQEQQGAPTSNAMLAKAGPLAGIVGGAALAYLNRRRGVRSSRTNAANVEKRVNDLISTAPINRPTRSTNVLAQRAANVNEVWRQGGAGENVPFRQLQSGEWRPRPNAVEPANLYPQKNTLYTTTDLGVAGTGFAEAALIQPLKWETQKKIDQLRSDRERYEAAGDVAGYSRAAKELAAAEDFYSTLVTMERLGIGLGATALGAPLKMRNASPKPNIAGAERDAALVRGAIEKRRQGMKK